MYAVRFVKRDALPQWQAWVMVRTEDGSCYLFIKRCAVCQVVLEQAWAAYNRLASRFGLAA